MTTASPNGKILFPYAGDSFGGSYVSSLLLVNALQHSGYDVTVGLHSEGVLIDYLEQMGVSWRRLPLIQSYAGFVGAQKYLAPLMRFLHENDIRIVHTNDRRMHSGWVLAARLVGAKHVWHQRNPMTSRSANAQALLASRIISVSEYCKGSLHRLNQRKALVIANPVESEVSGDELAKARAELVGEATGVETKVVGFFSNWERRKRPDVFVEIAAKLAALTNRSLVFALFGEPRPGMKDTVFSKIETLGLGGAVRVMGQKSPVEPWIAACDFVVAPALSEGMGRVLVEAMQLRTLVVAAADGGHLEIVQDQRTGMLFPPEDPDACAQQIGYLLDNEHEYKKIVDEAERYSRESFSLGQHTKAIIRVYDGLS